MRELAGTALLWGMLAVTSQGQTPAVNPLRGDLGVHDPVMLKADGTYFLFATGNGVAMKTSTDRITWRNAGRAFATNPGWHAQYVPTATASLWAPDISYRDGKYWLYYSVSTFGSNVSAIGLATATQLNAASGATVWTDQGMVVNTTSTSNHNAIDPNVVLDSAGTPWLSYGSFWSGIKLIQLDKTTGKPAAGTSLLSIAQYQPGIEAPFIIRHHGYYYHFVSFDRCCQGVNSTYNIRVGRSNKVNGPYVDSRGVAMTQGGGDLIDDGDSRWAGPGHNAIWVERDTVFLVNHAYDRQNNGMSTLWIRPLYWTPTGWPTLDASQGQAVVTIRERSQAFFVKRPGHAVDALGRRVKAGFNSRMGASWDAGFHSRFYSRLNPKAGFNPDQVPQVFVWPGDPVKRP